LSLVGGLFTMPANVPRALRSCRAVGLGDGNFAKRELGARSRSEGATNSRAAHGTLVRNERSELRTNVLRLGEGGDFYHKC
jgi:hypothetical protein